MNTVPAAGRGARRLSRGLCAVAIGLAALPAHADRWLLESRLNTGLDTNDNVSLSHDSPGRVDSYSVSGSLNASRQVENAVTGLKGDVTMLKQRGPGSQDRIDGLLAFSQSLSSPLDTYKLAAQYGQDFNNATKDVDVTLAPGRRRSGQASASWSRALSERLSANAQLGVDQTRYGHQVSGAIDYRDASVSAGLSYALDEITGLGMQTSYATYRPEDGNNRSNTIRFSASASRSWSPRSSVTLSVGEYLTKTTQVAFGLACPISAEFCRSGYVPYIVVTESVPSSRRGLEYSAGYQYQFDELLATSVSLARQQVPSGVGALVRSDTLHIQLDRNFTPRLSGSLGWTSARSTLPAGPAAGQPGRADFTATLSHQLTTQLTLQGGCRYTRSNDSILGLGGRATSMNVSLTYDGLRFEASR